MRPLTTFALFGALHTASCLPQGSGGKGKGGMPGSLGKSPVAFGPKPAGCSDFEILVARGTSEIGPFGLIVGDPLVAAVKRSVPGARGYAVQYPADATGKSAQTGRDDLVARLEGQGRACPRQKFALVGYSQGAMVVRMGTPKLAPEMERRILAVVMFGDPGIKGTVRTPLPGGLQSKLFENCAPGDPVCTAGSEFAPHLNYRQAKYQTPSTEFIVAAFKGVPKAAKPLPETHASGSAARRDTEVVNGMRP